MELIFLKSHGDLVSFMLVPMVVIFLILEVNSLSNMHCISSMCVL